MHAEISIYHSRSYCPLDTISPLQLYHWRHSVSTSNTSQRKFNIQFQIRGTRPFDQREVWGSNPSLLSRNCFDLNWNIGRLKEGNKSGTRFWRRWEAWHQHNKTKPKEAGTAMCNGNLRVMIGRGSSTRFVIVQSSVRFGMPNPHVTQIRVESLWTVNWTLVYA